MQEEPFHSICYFVATSLYCSVTQKQCWTD